MRNKIINALFLSILLNPQSVFSYDVAISFQKPLESYIVGCNDFWGTCVKPWHLGEDVDASAPTKVYAVANGEIKHAANPSGFSPRNFGSPTRIVRNKFFIF